MVRRLFLFVFSLTAVKACQAGHVDNSCSS